jgi:uncharacterized protein YjiS (DUF1127 family)
MTTLNAVAHHAPSAWGDRLSALSARFNAWNDARVTRRMLSGLSARELDDIGLTRADIDTVARRGA